MIDPLDIREAKIKKRMEEYSVRSASLLRARSDYKKKTTKEEEKKRAKLYWEIVWKSVHRRSELLNKLRFSCIYALVRRDEVYYVGRTRNLGSRLRRHRNPIGTYYPIEKVNQEIKQDPCGVLRWVVLEKTTDRSRERAWIEFFLEKGINLANIRI